MSDIENRKLCVVCSRIFLDESDVCPDDGTPLVQASDTDAGGLGLGALLGNYRLIRRLGEGGVGTVWEAEHVQLRRTMAIKVLHTDLLDKEAIARFFNEARAVNEICHPHIIEIEDFVEAPTGEVYLLMEHLSGIDLRQMIFDHGRLDPERVSRIGAQIADALGAAAELGIVHRDVKPDNIFVEDRDGDFCKVLDFGIVKFTGEQEGVTRAGMSVGTPLYMAPEQILPGGSVDERSDVYSLGMTLYEALVGETAFPRDSIAEILRGQCYEPVTPPSQALDMPLPPALEAAVMKCLEKEPDNRFQNMDELREALDSDTVVPLFATESGDPRRRGIKLRVIAPAIIMSVAAILLLLDTPDEQPAVSASPDAAVSHSSAPPTEPDPAPAPAPAPASVEEITVQLTTESGEAELFMGADRESLGSSPQSVAVAVSNEPVTFVARFDDGVEVAQTLVPDRVPPPLVFAKPAPEPVAASPRVKTTRRARTPRPKRTRVDREAPINPFQ